MTNSKAIGNKAERIAEKYLHEQGLKTLARNFTCRLGELDLIMKDGNDLVFVEVRYRYSASHGGPFESIDIRKCRKLRAAAETYLQKHPKLRNTSQRFDVIGIVGNIEENNHSLNWLQNAITEY